jgi:hypothetical protein
MLTHNPSDSSSSPYDPTMGDTVIYRPLKANRSGDDAYPAIIMKVNANDRVDLCVFTHVGIQFVRNVPYSGDESSSNTWSWMTPLQDRMRPIKLSVEVKSSATEVESPVSA